MARRAAARQVMARQAAPALGPIPAVGEHTGAILAELGFTDAEVAALREAGAV